VNKQERKKRRVRRYQEKANQKQKKRRPVVNYFFLPQIDLALDRPATLGSLESLSLPD
jgi:hypothetical protein